jgi:RNA polymerase sigma factor (sigma-70 family)
LLAYLHCQQAAEDILQETYQTAFLNIGQFQGQDFPTFYGWLKTIARRSLVDWWRRARRSVAVVDGPASSLLDKAPGSEERPSQAARRQERLAALRAALDNAGLTPKERAAIELHHLQGRSAKDAADLMQCTENHIRQLCFSGRNKLRRTLGDSAQFFSSHT